MHSRDIEGHSSTVPIVITMVCFNVQRYTKCAVIKRKSAADSSAQQSVRSQAVHQVLNDYHPFADQSSNYGSQKGAQGPAAATATTPRPAVLEAPAAIVPKPSWEEEELLRKVADLNRRDEELRIREELLFQRNVGFEVRINNFPPFPANCPIQPCFYQDFIVDIPAEFQKIIKMVYYLWIAYSGGLVLNIIGSLAYFISSAEHGISNQSGSTFGYSLLCCLLFVPCSFVCWYRPLYKAFRDDSSINFFVFFFTFFFQFCVSVIQCLGVGGFGTVGLFNSIEMFSAGKAGTVAAGMIMIITGLLFAAVAAANAVALVRIHRIFRSCGASFAKAQEEFTRGVMSNSAVRQTAGSVAASAVRSSVQQTFTSTH